MKCFRCGSTLDPRLEVCPRCGQDVRLYKRIVRTANANYNVGLARAQVRDLTGAVDALRRCLELNKRHIEARNLLGLVYHEMGETVLALREWVLSRSYRAQNNPAERYIKDLQSSQNSFEALMQNVAKYNLAVKYAQEGSKDLALVQLKKVTGSNTHLLRAQLLLALLYIEERQYSKAQRLLNRVLSIDRGNNTAVRYQEAIRELQHKAPEIIDEEENNLRKVANARVVIPNYGVAISSYLMNVAYVVIGIAIGILALYFLVMPSKQKQYADDAAGQVAAIEQEVLSRDSTIAELNAQIAALEQEKSSLQDNLDEMSSNSEETENRNLTIREAYDLTLDLARTYISEDYVTVAESVNQFSSDMIDSDAYRALYSAIYEQRRQFLYDHCWNNAEVARNALDYTTAIRLYDAAYHLNETSPTAYFWEAVCYHIIGQRETANAMYQEIIETFPGTSEAIQAAAQLAQP